MQIVVQELITHYEQQGSGKTILLLHGWADRLETFKLLMPELAKNYHVLAVDLPGFGTTQAPKDVWDLDDYARFVADFLKKLEARTDLLAVVGHSNGGAVAVRASALGLVQPTKLVLLASSGVRDTAGVKRAAIKLVAKTGKVLTLWLPKNTRKKLQKKLYGTVGSDMLITPELIETFKRTVRQDIQTDAAGLQLPTLLIYGGEDAATPVASIGKKLHSLIKNSRLEVITGADHFVHQAKPSQVLKLIQDFLKA